MQCDLVKALREVVGGLCLVRSGRVTGVTGQYWSARLPHHPALHRLPRVAVVVKVIGSADHKVREDEELAGEVAGVSDGHSEFRHQ